MREEGEARVENTHWGELVKDVIVMVLLINLCLLFNEGERGVDK